MRKLGIAVSRPFIGSIDWRRGRSMLLLAVAVLGAALTVVDATPAEARRRGGHGGGSGGTDRDSDLIVDVVDADGGDGSRPGEFQNGTLVGQIVAQPADWAVYISDEPEPEGVFLRTEGTGTPDLRATVEVCGFTLQIPANTETVLTCGSVIARVEVGSVEVVLGVGEGRAVVTVPEGVDAEVGEMPGGSFFVDVLAETEDGTGTGATVTQDGRTTTVSLEGGEAVVDTTAPVVTYSGNQGVYTIDRQVSITCAATDSGSGVASTTCRPVQGPAADFGIGLNTFSATATDAAGNVGTASGSFTVKVTYDSLRTLTSRYSSQPVTALTMCATLALAEKAAAKGLDSSARFHLGLYLTQVRLYERLRVFTHSEAATLVRGAEALISAP